MTASAAMFNLNPTNKRSVNAINARSTTAIKRRRISPTSVRRITSSLTSLSSHEYDPAVSPQHFFKQVLQSIGISAAEKRALHTEKGFFTEPTPEQIASYGHDLIRAVRNRDVDALREELKNGDRSLQCCNKFGESLIHMACRRGFTEVVEFLVKEAGVSIRIKDDYGRTPLHDACWTTEPNFELMDLLMETDPDLLLVVDKRGNSPLDYVRREHWGTWVNFLDSRRDNLCPRESGKLLISTQ